MTFYAEYSKSTFPAPGNVFRPREHKLIETAQCGHSTEAGLRAALAAASAGDLILLAPCTITLTETLVIDKPIHLQGSTLSGDLGTKLTGAFGSELISIALDAPSGLAEVSLANLYIKQGSDDTDVIAVDNADVGKKLKIRLDKCIVENLDSAANSWAIDVAHSSATYEIQIKISGRGWEKCGPVNFTIKNVNDSLEFYQMRCNADAKASAVVSSSDAVAGAIRFFRSEVPQEKGCSGGNAAQEVVSVRSYSLTGRTYAALDTNDLIGSQTETIV